MSEFDESNLPPVDPQPSPPPLVGQGGGSSSIEREREVRNWAVFIHLSALAGLLGIPAGNVIGPLVIWMIKKDSLPEIDEHGREALNFQITMLIAFAISIPLCFIVIGFFTLIAAMILQLIFSIIAGIKASEGTVYRYPLSIRFLSGE